MLIQFYHVYKRFSHGINVLNDVSLEINRGDLIIIVGKTGAGKTTFIRLAYGEIWPTLGHVFILGKNIKFIKRKELTAIRRKIAMIPQEVVHLLPNESVFYNICLPLKLMEEDTKIIQKKALYWLNAIELTYKKSVPVRELSYGEKKIVGVVASLIKNPYIILADEPFSGLDANASDKLLDLLLKVANDNKAAFVITSSNLNIIHQINNKINNYKKQISKVFFITNGELKTPEYVEKLDKLFKKSEIENIENKILFR